MKFSPNPFYKFLFFFLSLFTLIYFGFQFISGLAVEGGNYSPFVAKYFNIASWVRQALIFCTKQLVALLGINSYVENEYVLRAEGGAGIKLIYGCLGIGVYSFWIAYTVASTYNFLKKISWLFVGLFILWTVNVLRISLVLISLKNNWVFPLGLDHHTWFNIVAYIFIFLLIFLFEKNIKQFKKSITA